MLKRLHDLLRLRTSPPIFFGSAAVIILFVILTITLTEWMDSIVSVASDWLYTNLGWFYILGVTFFLVFLIFIAISRFGRVRLGADDETPEHSGPAWFSMLFAAGIGSILMFWGVAEPVSHFGDPPRGPSLGIEAGTAEAAADAMNFTFYHFTLHTWTIFALPSLCFAYFIHKRNLPPRVSSIFQPLLGKVGSGFAVDQVLDLFLKNEDLIDTHTAFIPGMTAGGAAASLHEGGVFDIIFIQTEEADLIGSRGVGLSTFFADAADKTLCHDGADGRCHKEGFDTHIDESGHGAGGVVGVERTEHQVTGKRCVDGDFCRFQVSDFTDHDDVRRLTEHTAQCGGESHIHRPVDLHLIDTGELVFDRVLNGDKFTRSGVDGIQKCIKRSGFTRTGTSGNSYD